jgi:hypothetical protein
MTASGSIISGAAASATSTRFNGKEKPVPTAFSHASLRVQSRKNASRLAELSAINAHSRAVK